MKRDLPEGGLPEVRGAQLRMELEGGGVYLRADCLRSTVRSSGWNWKDAGPT